MAQWRARGGGGLPALCLAKWKRVALVLLLLWVVVTYLVISPLRCGGNSDELAAYQQRLRHVTSQLESLKHQHSSLVTHVRKYSGFSEPFNLDTSLLAEGPSEEYETLRRHIYTNTKELWYYIKSELSKALPEADRAGKISGILKEISERKNSLLSDQQKLPSLDGHEEWRRAEAANVSDLVQRRLRHLQNPADCREARKVICNLNKGCGFGCQLHHIVYCLIFAYATERTLILHSKGWRYNPKGWDYVFHPVSDTCTDAFDDPAQQWPASYESKVVSLPFIDSMTQKPKFLPLAIPKDLAHRILRFNGDPASWWIGQIVKFCMRPREPLLTAINDTIQRLHFQHPIVGVHIRRTDKVGTEAAFHHIHEYMSHVEDYYDMLEKTQPVPVRRVYLASDDANVLADARKKYSSYEFLGDAGIAKTAATHRRYTPASLTGLLLDLHLLGQTDYLVCTFSSQVGRVAYEMMQANRVDASQSVYSLDDIYYFGGQNAHDRAAVLPHVPLRSQDIAFQVGDLIGVAGNHWDGYGRGTNRRTNANGLIPWYKTTDHLVLYPFPEYKEVPLFVEPKSSS